MSPREKSTLSLFCDLKEFIMIKLIDDKEKMAADQLKKDYETEVEYIGIIKSKLLAMVANKAKMEGN